MWYKKRADKALKRSRYHRRESFKMDGTEYDHVVDWYHRARCDYWVLKWHKMRRKVIRNRKQREAQA